MVIYCVYLIRAKSAFAKTLRNAWNFSTKFDLIQNLCALLHYTKVYHVGQGERNIFHTKFIILRYFKSPYKDRIQEEMTKIIDFYVHLNFADAHLSLSINLKTCQVLLKECGQLLEYVSDL